MKINFIKKLFACLFILLILSNVFIGFVKADSEVPSIDSPSALLMDLDSGKILYEKNIYEKMYPASLTKIMTAILVIENCDLSANVEVSYDAVMSVEYGYVTANLQIGEVLTVEQLLNILLVGSANDAAIVLAEHVSGSVEEFANLMNEKAKEIGCTSTHFVNPNGIHDEDHYSTAYDLALISKYAMKNETFKSIVSKTSYSLPATNKYEKEDRFFTTTNALLMTSNNGRADNYYYKYATGVKTGFTTPAQNCLVASADKSGFELLVVILGAGQTSDGLSARYLDTIKLFDYGYDNYSFKKVLASGSVVQTTNIKNATNATKKLDAIASEDLYVLVKQENKDTALLPEVHLNDDLKAPISAGDVIGTVSYKVDGNEYTENLLAKNNVEKSNAFIRIIIILLFVIICYFYLKLTKMKKKNRRKAKIRKK